MTKTDEWTDWYFNGYLKSDEWAAKREARLARDHYVCQGCLTPIPAQATQVHHLTYERVELYHAHELMCDLISLCDACHANIHGKPPKRRGKENTQWKPPRRNAHS